MTTTLTAGTSTVEEVHVWEPHSAGLPRLGPYFRELWRRRPFAVELARTELKAKNFDTALGQVWLILNPLMLGLIYSFLIYVIGRGGSSRASFLPQLLANLFLYYMLSTSVIDAASSIVSGGRLILNTAFPRMLLPLSTVLLAFYRFLPTLAIAVVAHFIARYPTNFADLLAIIPVIQMLVFAAGLAMIAATLQVYFRDARSFLPYLMRLWMYISPVLYTVKQINTLPHVVRHVMAVNPLYHMIGNWSNILDGSKLPSVGSFLIATVWAVGALLVGMYVFLTRERDFAIRI